MKRHLNKALTFLMILLAFQCKQDRTISQANESNIANFSELIVAVNLSDSADQQTIVDQFLLINNDALRNP